MRTPVAAGLAGYIAMSCLAIISRSSPHRGDGAGTSPSSASARGGGGSYDYVLCRLPGVRSPRRGAPLALARKESFPVQGCGSGSHMRRG
jgi:hypothetical protein